MSLDINLGVTILQKTMTLRKGEFRVHLPTMFFCSASIKSIGEIITHSLNSKVMKIPLALSTPYRLQE